MTNADRIRNVNDTELADIIRKLVIEAINVGYGMQNPKYWEIIEIDGKNRPIKISIIGWLKQEET